MPHDPYDTPNVRTFECLDCGKRTDAETQPMRCPTCGGDVRDISVPRAQ
jgi:Zn finger protein HypA/HybF involved in hydrogenase expression